MQRFHVQHPLSLPANSAYDRLLNLHNLPAQPCSFIALHRSVQKRTTRSSVQCTSPAAELARVSDNVGNRAVEELVHTVHGDNRLSSAAPTARGRRKRKHTATDFSLGAASSSESKTRSALHAGNSTASRHFEEAGQHVTGQTAAPVLADALSTRSNGTDQYDTHHSITSSRRRSRASRSRLDSSTAGTSSNVPNNIAVPSAAAGDQAANLSSGLQCDLTEQPEHVPAAASTTKAARASSRNNPILRAIRIVQLKQQQSRASTADTSSNSSASSHAQQTQPPPSRNQVNSLHEHRQQQEQQEAATARPMAAGPSQPMARPQQQTKPRAALPPDEVLVTESSHLNPVYRRIRLQELRLRLQQQLRGPQLQRQLQQVQQQQQTVGHPPSSAERVSGSSNTSSSGIRGGASTTRGPTQGLNSVQRAIRIAQLQRVLQQRHELASRSSSSRSSRASASWGPAAGGASTAVSPHPWFLSPAAFTGNHSVSPGSRRSSTRQQQQIAAAGAQLMQQLIAAGVSAAVASAITSLNTHSPTAAGLAALNSSSSSSSSSGVIDRLLQLQHLLGLSSVGAAARIVIKQPNLLKRDPETLRQNIQEIVDELQLTKPQVCRMLSTYPAALYMSPASVAARAATLAATLEIPARQAVKVAYACPRILGLSPATLSCKVSELQNFLELPSKVAAVELIKRFPAVLGLSSTTLAGKYQRLKSLAQRRPDWQQQLAHIKRHKPGTLGRVLVAGPRVVERLQYLLEAGDSDEGHDTSNNDSVSDSQIDNMGLGYVQQLNTGQQLLQESSAAKTDGLIANQHVDGYNNGIGFRSSVRKGGLPGGNMAALLIMSEANFTALHPEFVLWRLKQRSAAAQ